MKAHENKVFLLFDSLQYLNTFFCEMQRGILYFVFCLVLTLKKCAKCCPQGKWAAKLLILSWGQVLPEIFPLPTFANQKMQFNQK